MPGPRPFRLRTVLRIRRHQEDLKSQALAGTRRALQVADHQHVELVQQQRRAMEQAEDLTRHEFNAGDVERYHLYERHLARLVVEKDAELTQLRELEAQHRSELEEAVKQRRTVELIEERHLRAREVWLRRELQRVIDESATNQAAIRRIEQRDT